MPNHILNRISVSNQNDDLQKIKDFLRSEECDVDFNKILPQPENIFRGDLGKEEEDYCKKNNIPTWYNWNTKNWGTKWNAYSININNDNIEFETAWNGVPNLMLKLSENFPDTDIIYEFADEDVSSNCAEFIFKNGKVLYENLPLSRSKEAYDLYFKLWGYMEEYRFIDGNYVYMEDDEYKIYLRKEKLKRING